MTKRYTQRELAGKPPRSKRGPVIETPAEPPMIRRGRSWADKMDDLPHPSKAESSITRAERKQERKPVINRHSEDGLFPWQDVLVIDSIAWKPLTGDVLMTELRKIKDDALDAQQACVARPVRDVEHNEIDWSGFPE